MIANKMLHAESVRCAKIQHLIGLFCGFLIKKVIISQNCNFKSDILKA